MSWTALIPFKPGGGHKSRLSVRLSAEERARLARRMLDHVASVLSGSPRIGQVILLAGTPPPGWTGGWIADQGRGLNAELEAARNALDARRLLVIHADLPGLMPDDISILLAAAEGCGAAIAPDRHGMGTNALALASGTSIAFAFGPGSFARHRAQLSDTVAVIARPGLTEDIDEPADLDAAIAAGLL